MEEINKTLLKEQLQWYQLQRHDYLNHFQVVMGYLQLHKPEKALTYLKSMFEGLEAEQRLAQIPHPQISAIILGWIIELKQSQVDVMLDFTDDMKTIQYWEKNWKEEYAQEFYGYTRECLKAATPFLNRLDQDSEDGKLFADIILSVDSKGWQCSFTLLQGTQELLQTIWRNGNDVL